MVIERIRKAKRFYEKGLVGLVEDDGNILYPAKYEQIEICRDLIFMIKPDGIYSTYQPEDYGNGYMPPEERPYLVSVGIIIQ